MDLSNKPNLQLTGSNWDATHLDKFLDSEWGDKLFNASRFRSSSAIPYPIRPVFETSIRPSVSFLNQPRESSAPTVYLPSTTLSKTNPSPLQTTSFRATIQPLSEQRLKRGELIKSLEQRAAELTNAQAALLRPIQRRALLNSKLETLKKLQKTKAKHASDTKLSRILEHGYPRGVLVAGGESIQFDPSSTSPRQQGKD